jgi:hypothetical protein
VSAWGGYVFIINLIPLHVFFLIIMGRFSEGCSLLLFFLFTGLSLLDKIPCTALNIIGDHKSHITRGNCEAVKILRGVFFFIQLLPGATTESQKSHFRKFNTEVSSNIVELLNIFALS